MKQYRITSKDINPVEDNDCYLSPDDPIHALMPSAMMGGLGASEAMSVYNNLQLPQIQGSDKGRIAREKNIQPGTDLWFKHWFGRA
jgi:hypothetical protein